MSFYVSLPSNSSMNLYDNTLSNYTTQLSYPIKLNGPYEVGLVEMIYDANWDVDLGLWAISIDGVDYKIPIIHNDGQSVDNLCQSLSKKLLYQFSQNELDRSNRKSSLESITSDILDKVPKLKYVNNQIEIVIKQFIPFQCEFSGLFAEIYDLQNKIYNNSNNIIELSKHDYNLRIISTLYIYCDIIKFQYVGDSQSPLLRNVVIPHSTLFNSTNFTVFDSPHYLPVNYTNISTINIKILDEFGSQIKFTSGRTILKLHFRPQRYGF